MARHLVCEQCSTATTRSAFARGDPECQVCGNDEFRELHSGTLSDVVDDPGDVLAAGQSRRRILAVLGALGLVGAGVWWTNIRAPVAETTDVSLVDGQFQPRNVEVDVDDEVTWTNDAKAPEGADPPTYILTSSGGAWEFEAELPPGESASFTFEDGGQYEAAAGLGEEETDTGMAMKIGVGESVEDPLQPGE